MIDGRASTFPGAVADPRPAPGWLHVAVAWLEGLPGPAWIAYVALGLASMLFWHLIPWSRGSTPVGSLDSPSLYWGFLAPALLWTAGYLERGAAASFDAFRSILAMPADEAERLRDALTAVPARSALIITAISAVLTLGAVVSDPVTYTDGVPVPLIVLEFLAQTVLAGMLFQLLYWLLRQTTLVRRTLDHSAVIDVFRPGPLHAFATLTSRPGIVINVLVAISVLIVPVASSVDAFLVGAAPYLLVPPVIAIVAFVVPLSRAHARLAEQKEQLQGEAELRLEAILSELNHDVDARDFARADGLSKTLGSLAVQREILAKLHTWPWTTATLRGFVPAILLPMVLFLVQLAISRMF
jgi:hypothetical protein